MLPHNYSSAVFEAHQKYRPARRTPEAYKAAICRRVSATLPHHVFDSGRVRVDGDSWTAMRIRSRPLVPRREKKGIDPRQKTSRPAALVYDLLLRLMRMLGETVSAYLPAPGRHTLAGIVRNRTVF